MKILTILAAMASTFLLSGTAHAASTCIDGVDNDKDGWIDKADPDCETSDTELGYNPKLTCNDGTDNDHDGQIDARDTFNCPSASSEESGDCADAIDNDKDGWIDGEDPSCMIVCFSEPCWFSETGYSTDFTCNDGLDNDGDGLIDAKDPDCIHSTDTEGTTPTGNCADGIDNDQDGWIDKYDPDCTVSTDSELGFGTQSTCNDGIDNDVDGLVDVKDADNCFTGYDNETGNCWDGKDNDGDGWADLDDPDCPAVKCLCYFTEVGYDVEYACNDREDNDRDGDIDAFDVDCVNGYGTSEGESGGCAASRVLPVGSRAFAPVWLMLGPLAWMVRRRARRQ